MSNKTTKCAYALQVSNLILKIFNDSELTIEEKFDLSVTIGVMAMEVQSAVIDNISKEKFKQKIIDIGALYSRREVCESEIKNENP